MSKDSNSNTFVSIRLIQGGITVVALLVAAAHLLWPDLTIDAITLALLTLACVPWLGPIFKSLEFPGGFKVTFPDLQSAGERAEVAGLLARKGAVAETKFAFERIVQEDPNLALAGLRMEIEKRLVELAEKSGVETQSRGVGQLLRLLTANKTLGHQERSVLADLTGLLNGAVHGAKLDPRATKWAVDVGPRLLGALDELINAT